MKELMDYRGYAVCLGSPSEQTVQIGYLGAVQPEYEGESYDEDPFTVPRVKDREFRGNYRCVLRDTGITASGLKLCLSAAQEAEVTVSVCGELRRTFRVGPGTEGELVISPDELGQLCTWEKEYLAAAHRVLYRLIGEVDRVCRKHHIPYFLVFGGLLGVLRYGEMIPWDDDVDVAMTRKDFERFRKIAPKELGEGFRYLDCRDLGNGAFLDFLCRIVCTEEQLPLTIFSKVSGKCRKEIEGWLPLDIYILDNASDSPRLHKLHMFLIRTVYGLGMGHRAHLDFGEYTSAGKFTAAAVRGLAAAGRIIPAPLIFSLHDWISTLFRGKKTKTYFMSNGFLPFIHTRYDRAWFEKASEVEFGGMKLLAPGDVKAYLKRAYYDYYHYPAVEKRVPGHGPSRQKKGMPAHGLSRQKEAE